MTVRLHSGTILGPYRIVAPLGSGGMGEVFKAHDAKLDRAVALKILPAEVVREPERVRRFVQEARSASSLSHPNIITIYDIGQAVAAYPSIDASADASEESFSRSGEPIHYIAMELVEGSTLRQLFGDRSVEPRTLLAYLAQAAEGLAKAHSAAIVHRDLKPENVMVTRDGYAKVLDFGLAKLTESAASGSALAAAPTALQEDNTREGAVVGTIGYMSPEQAQGKPVDHRTDLFSFGCLLYEAATGRRPFTGESSVDVLHAIVREKPTPVEEIAPTIPRALVRTIRRCLAKEPERRYQSMKDLALELHEIVDEWESLETPSGTVSSSSALSAAAPAAQRGPGRVGWIAIAVAAIAVATVLVVLLRRPPTPQAAGAAAATSFQSMRIAPLTTNGHVVDVALSADGKYLAYTRIDPAGVSLWVRQVATGSDVEVLPARSPQKPITAVRFTPDGDYLDLVRVVDDPKLPDNIWELVRLPVLGGAPRRIVLDIDTPPAYSPDGKQLAFVRQIPARSESALIVTGIEGGAERALASTSFQGGSRFRANYWTLGPAWSPDGRRIAVPLRLSGRAVSDQIALVDATSGEIQTLGDYSAQGLNGLAWSFDGRSLFVTAQEAHPADGHQIWRVSYPAGGVTRLTNDLSDYQGVRLSADGGSLASTQARFSSELWILPLSPSGAATSISRGALENFADLDVSDDGNVVACLQRSGESHLWRVARPGGERTQLSHGAGESQPRVSRDGRSIVYLGRSGGGQIELFAMGSDGGNVRQLGLDGSEEFPAISGDGRIVAFVRSARDGIWVQPFAGGEAKRLIPDPQAWGPRFSPDGTKLLYATSRMGANGMSENLLRVVGAAGGAPLVELPRPASETWRWSADQRSLLFLRIEGDGYNVWRLPLDGKPVERVTSFESTPIFDFVPADGGRSLIYSKGEIVSDAVLLTNFE